MKAGEKTRAHHKACREYKISFWEEHGYIFCEICKVNEVFPPHSTHHILNAAQWSWHPAFHNPLNLILLCHRCHTAHEENRRQDEHDRLVKERGLKDLFKKVLT